MYMSNCSLSDCLMATKKHFFHFGSFNTKDGSEIRIWEDKWLGNITLREQYTILYNIVHHKSDRITTVRKYHSPRLAALNVLLGRLVLTHLLKGTNEFR